MNIEYVHKCVQYVGNVTEWQCRKLYSRPIVRLDDNTVECIHVCVSVCVCGKTWKDYRLTWHESNFSGLSHVYLSTSDIWIPDATLYNKSDLSTFQLVSFICSITKGLVFEKNITFCLQTVVSLVVWDYRLKITLRSVDNLAPAVWLFAGK